MDIKTQIVPNYIGLEKKKLKSPYFTFSFMGEGEYVIDQLPRVGEKIEEGSKIMIMLGDKYENN
jgi:stage V sporulation protein D (sporulation-specific penicillin-binding protein)